MDCSDMLDVLHYYFEEDFINSSEEAAARKSAVRESMYPLLYEAEYKYPFSAQGREQDFDPELIPDDGETPLDIPKPFSPNKTAKPYIPPTQVSENSSAPFGSILDSPLK